MGKSMGNKKLKTLAFRGNGSGSKPKAAKAQPAKCTGCKKTKLK